MIPQLQREAAAAPVAGEPRWSLAERIGFRFVFSYFVFYIAPGPVGSLTEGERATSYGAVWSAMWHGIVLWVGRNILGLKGDLREVANGSGDQLYDYVLLLCILVMALIATVMWSWLDRKRPNYRQLFQWLRLSMRFLLWSAMITYGACKLFPMQFAGVPLARLVDPVGHLTPMGLLWTFMGYSRAYSFFAGCAEVLGGLLLMVPRFTTLGALVSLGVLSNVLMLNLCYDVDRKILTIHLLLIAIFLVLPDTKRLTSLFLFNRTAEPADPVSFFEDKQLNQAVFGFQYLCAAISLFFALQFAHQLAAKNLAHIGRPLQGIWTVEKFVWEDTTQPSLLSDQERWRNVIFEKPDLLTIQPIDGQLQRYSFKLANGGRSISFSKLRDPEWNATFTLQTQEKDRLLMVGEVQGRAVSATLHRLDLSDWSRFLLINRGFHWVNQVTPWLVVP